MSHAGAADGRCPFEGEASREARNLKYTFFSKIAVQVGAMEVARNDLLAVVASRLEGSTWDGTLRLYRVQQSSKVGVPAATPGPAEEVEGDDR